MKFPVLCIAVATCCALSPAYGADLTRISPTALAAAVNLREQALKDPAAYDFVADLTTQIGPRLAGGENDQRARDWTIERFKALGFDKV